MGQMDRRGRNEGMNAPLAGIAHSFAGAVDIGRDGARQAGDGRVLDLLGHGHHGFEVTIGGNREARLDDVDAHLVQRFGHL
ncbi:hypothetical protein D9M68_848600 [compost metagenome]